MLVKQRIKEKGYTLEQVGQRMKKKMSQQSMSALLRDDGNPSINRLQEIASIIGCRMADFFEDSQELTALIEYRGEMYKASTVEELLGLAEKFKSEKDAEPSGK